MNLMNLMNLMNENQNSVGTSPILPFIFSSNSCESVKFNPFDFSQHCHYSFGCNDKSAYKLTDLEVYLFICLLLKLLYTVSSLSRTGKNGHG